MMMTQDARRLEQFEPGGDLYVRDRAAPSAPETNVTGELTQGMGDVRDAEASFDGTKIVFALHLPMIEGADPEDQPTWNIWEYDVPGRALRRVIPSDIIAEEGHDIAPHYLPDGHRVLVDAPAPVEGDPARRGQAAVRSAGRGSQEPAFLLHVMNADAAISTRSRSTRATTSTRRSWTMGASSSAAGTRRRQRRINLYAMLPDGSQLGCCTARRATRPAPTAATQSS